MQGNDEIILPRLETNILKAIQSLMGEYTETSMCNTPNIARRAHISLCLDGTDVTEFTFG